jgi:leader peptidase (prepilin peptidase)/N-methyltransferase
MPLRTHGWDIAIGLATAALSLALLPLPVGGFAAALAVLAVFIAVVDIEHLIIPDLANALVFVLGLALVAVGTRADERFPAMVDAVLRALATGLLLYGLRFAYQRMNGIEGLGLGDVKLAAAAGPWLAWPSLPFAIAVAAIAALLTTGLRALRTGTRPQWQQELPFGAFLAPAIWVSFMIERLCIAPG